TQNVGNWQWVAGTGPDAAPYFRIFNPTTQAEKFDPTGDYVRSWVPELGELPDKWIHDPSSAPDEVLAEAGVELGRDYPEPLVDHGAARERTLAAYEAARDDA
ncbi:MAG: FAD-binding domain-containing protein, partial [Microthrixaceae bacterium]|nr:FAD-binding domain-containing protein [Microthrixaceae bacterium]